MPRPPPLACDCHTHLFGPFARYPLDASRKYTPADAPLEDYLRVAAALGTGRVVLVQPSVYGTDNSCQRDALIGLGERARGVAVIDDSVSDAQLGELDRAGFRGARLNVVRTGGETALDALERVAGRAADVGWHLQLHLPGSMIPEIADRLLKLPTGFVIDHMGRMDARLGTSQPAFQALLRLLGTGRCWVKLSAPYRIDVDGPPYAGAAPFAHELVKCNPERLVWGTDWPHPDVVVLPEDHDLLEVMLEWAPDEGIRNRILMDNPAKLYRF